MSPQRGAYGQKVVVYSKATKRSIRQINSIGGTENCINCAIAQDAMLAGFPAWALAGGPERITVLEEYFSARFGAPCSLVSVHDHMVSAGFAARGIVYGYRTSGVGHVFNVVNQRGLIRFLDGQTGQSARLDGYLQFQLLRTNK